MAQKTEEREGLVRRTITTRVEQVPGRDRVLRFVASTEEIARDGDIVRVAGWETDKFMQNPVFLWAHQHDEPPIGKVLKTKKVLRSKDGGGPRLEIDVEFAGLDQLHEDAERIYLLYRDQFLRAVSVGFMPLEYQDLAEDQRKELGLGAWGRVIKRAELWEVSAVPVPADTGALVIEDEGDRAACKEALLAVRGLAPAEEQPRFDALAASLDAPPEATPLQNPAPTPVPDPLLTELRALREEQRALRALVEERLPAPRAPEVPAVPAPADGTAAPATPRSPTTGDPPPTPEPVKADDFYSILDARLERTMSTKE